MTGLLLIKDSLANKISYYHFLLLMVSLPFDMFYSHLILISLIIHTLIQLKKDTIKPVFKLRMIVLQSVFFVTVLSTAYSLNPNGAFQEWGTRITILLIPLLFCLNPLDIKKYRANLLMIFALVCTATIIYLYADAIFVIRHYQLPLSTLFSVYFTNHNFSQPIAIHATFFSMQIGIALVYLLSIFIKERSLYHKLFYLCCCGILSAGLVQLGSKSVVIAMTVLINLAVPYFLLNGKGRRRFILTSGSLTILVIAMALSSGNFSDRFVKGFKNDLSKKVAGETDDTRLARWNVSLELIGKSPIIGYGAGSEIGLLQNSFFNEKLYSSYLNRLNTHNEYFSFLLKSGIVGLLIYVFTLAFGFRTSIRDKDILFFTFMLIIAFVSMSENLLDVDKGIIFYSFFFSLFVFSDEERQIGAKPVEIIINNKAKATKELVAAS